MTVIGGLFSQKSGAEDVGLGSNSKIESLDIERMYVLEKLFGVGSFSRDGQFGKWG